MKALRKFNIEPMEREVQVLNRREIDLITGGGIKQLLLIVVFVWCGISLHGQEHNCDGVLFFNSIYIGPSVVFMDLDKIDSISLKREPVEINGKLYNYQVHIFSSRQVHFITRIIRKIQR